MFQIVSTRRVVCKVLNFAFSQCYLSKSTRAALNLQVCVSAVSPLEIRAATLRFGLKISRALQKIYKLIYVRDYVYMKDSPDLFIHQTFNLHPGWITDY